MGVLGPNQLDIKLDFDDVRFRGGCLGLGTAGQRAMVDDEGVVRPISIFVVRSATRCWLIATRRSETWAVVAAGRRSPPS